VRIRNQRDGKCGNRDLGTLSSPAIAIAPH